MTYRAHNLPPLSAQNGERYYPDYMHGQGLRPVDHATASRWREELETIREPHWLIDPIVCATREPLAITCMLDLLLRLEPPRASWTSGQLFAALEVHYPGILWTPVGVGRLIANICDAQPDAPALRAITKGITNGIHTYKTIPTPRGWIWLTRAREAAGRAARERAATAIRSRSLPGAPGAFPWDLLDGLEATE